VNQTKKSLIICFVIIAFLAGALVCYAYTSSNVNGPAQLYYGNGPPNTTDHYSLGSFYIDVSCGAFYQLQDDCHWVYLWSMIGSQGATGATGSQGPEGQSGSQIIFGNLTLIDNSALANVPVGSCYICTLNNTLTIYQKNMAGTSVLDWMLMFKYTLQNDPPLVADPPLRFAKWNAVPN
jgi:hypothetical protein